jgi:hypothetical protein
MSRVLPRVGLPNGKKPVTFTFRNVYQQLPKTALALIAQERNIVIEEKNHIAAELDEYDKVFPDWRERSISRLGERQCEMYLYGAKIGINYFGLTFRSAEQHRAFIGVFQHKTLPLSEETMMQYLGWLNNEHKVTLMMGHNLNVYQISFLTTREMARIIMFNEFPAVLSGRAERYQYLLQHKRVVMLKQLYGPIQADTHEQWMVPHPMEKMIENFDSYTDKQFIDCFGIMVPINRQDTAHDYIEANFTEYKHVLTRTIRDGVTFEGLLAMSLEQRIVKLSKLKDTEAVQIVGVVMPYHNRDSLIRRLAKSFDRPRFMHISVKNTTRSINSSTTLLTEVTDPDTFMVCFGTAGSYYTYELQELYVAFHQSDTGIMMFRRPEKQVERFLERDIDSLVDLLHFFTLTDDIINLLERISAVRLLSNEGMRSFTVIAQSFAMLRDKQKGEVKDFLMAVFRCGMYQRRWIGPPHPYPMTYAQSMIDYDPAAGVTDSIIAIEELLSNMTEDSFTLCRSLPSITHDWTVSGNINGITLSNITTMKQIEDVKNEQQCIRYAGVVCVRTAHFYIKRLFNQEIPGFAPVSFNTDH